MPEQDTTPPVTPFPEIPDSLRRPPITPRRAFLMSLLLPGSAQARLNRPKASMLFAVAEILCIGMTRKSGQDLREARSAPKDSIIAGYVINPTTGAVTPTADYAQNRFTPARLRARRTHYEDWIAALIFNHLISSADAYVSANLWDFPANVTPNVSVNPRTRTTVVSASVAF